MLDVLAPGLLTTVQDPGRPGLRHLGVPAGGAADRDALMLANRLIGNAPEAAGIETTLVGPVLRVRRATVLVLTGGQAEARADGHALPMWRPVAVAAGTTIDLGRVRRGARCYLAIAGGIAVPRVLGARATDLRGGFGGLAGRALAVGDRLRSGPVRLPTALAALVRRREAAERAILAADFRLAPSEDLRGDLALLHLLPGRDLDALSPRVLRALRDGIWTVAPDSDRMGLRFDGPEIPAAALHDRISSAVLPGTVQLPPDGRPILLGVDAQTVGGYPQVAQVIRADLGLAMQLRPGQKVRAVLVTPEAAAAAWLARRRTLARMAEALAGRLRRE